MVLESIRVVRFPWCSKARVEDGERGKGLVVLDEVWLGTTGVIVLGVGNISHPSHRQVKTPGRTLLPAMEKGIDDIGCIYMRLPDVELSQELSCLPNLAVTCRHRARQSHYRSDKGHPEERDSRIRVTRCASRSYNSSRRRSQALRSDI